MGTTLAINNLQVKLNGKILLTDVSLVLKSPEICVLMGPNGSGKSTLAKVLAGHPDYAVTGGSIKLNARNLLKMSPEDRARAGVYLAFQSPTEVPGVNVLNFLYQIHQTKEAGISLIEFRKSLLPHLELIHLSPKFLERDLHVGFSGGEKKKLELLQLAVLKPKVIILDEIDAGLDVDALKVVAQGIIKFRPPDSVVLLITHYQRILHYLKPDKIHVLMDGTIKRSDGMTLVKRIEEKGYAAV